MLESLAGWDQTRSSCPTNKLAIATPLIVSSNWAYIWCGYLVSPSQGKEAGVWTLSGSEEAKSQGRVLGGSAVDGVQREVVALLLAHLTHQRSPKTKQVWESCGPPK